MRTKMAIVYSFLALGGCDLSGEESGEGGDTEGTASGGESSPGEDYCSGVSSWDAGMIEFEEDVLVLVNEARAAGASCGGQSFGPADPLAMNAALRCAARVHSKDMLERNFFAHDNPDGEDPFVRMQQAGYEYFTAGENIAAGQPTPAAVMQSWMSSPGHCSNIMNPDFTELGVGAFTGSGAEFSLYWTQTLGAR